MRTCDVCKEPLGIIGKFKYADGYICKKCYKKASRQFTETIMGKSLQEIKELCGTKRDEKSFEEFEMTGRIGNFLLIDELNQKICIPNNRMTSQKVSDPEFYNIEDIIECQIVYQPKMTLEELEKKIAKREEGTIRFLKVSISMKNKKKKDICLISNPVRIKSYAFRQSFNFAKRIHDEIHRLTKELADGKPEGGM